MVPPVNTIHLVLFVAVGHALINFVLHVFSELSSVRFLGGFVLLVDDHVADGLMHLQSRG